MSGDVQTDLSGNPILKDVGPWLKSEIKKRFKDADVKYIDPSYLIRSIPTTSNDRIYCKILAHNAVHAAFAGFTGVTVGLVNTHYVLLPIPVVIQAPRRVSLHLFTIDNSRPDSLFRQDSNTCCMQPQVACEKFAIGIAKSAFAWQVYAGAHCKGSKPGLNLHGVLRKHPVLACYVVFTNNLTYLVQHWLAVLFC